MATTFKNLPDTSTPLNAENLNNDFILLNLSTKFTWDGIDYAKVPFNILQLQNGSKLTFDANNNEIIIGKGVNYVRVDCELWCENNISNYISMSICINGVVYTYSIYQQHYYPTWGMLNAFKYLRVVEGDRISIVVRKNENIDNFAVRGDYGNSCNMSVQVIG